MSASTGTSIAKHATYSLRSSSPLRAYYKDLQRIPRISIDYEFLLTYVRSGTHGVTICTESILGQRDSFRFKIFLNTSVRFATYLINEGVLEYSRNASSVFVWAHRWDGKFRGGCSLLTRVFVCWCKSSVSAPYHHAIPLTVRGLISHSSIPGVVIWLMVWLDYLPLYWCA